MVGQRLVSLLEDHPWFECGELVASERSAGRSYVDVVDWQVSSKVPERVRDIPVLQPDPTRVESPLIFSALDASVARDVEQAFAKAGRAVVSNARSHRLDVDVPLVVPEVNPEQLALIDMQRSRRGWGGYIVTNPNCSVIGLTLALAPLHEEAGVRKVVVSTLQALSGAGYPGVASLAVADNVVPGIPGEEEKLESEPLKILGELSAEGVEPAEMELTAHTHRVGVSDGHLLAVSLETGERLSVKQATDLLARFEGAPQRLALPSAPKRPILVNPAPDRPQPRFDREAGDGMSVTAGRIRPCKVLGLALEILSHNTIRGAAGGTLLIAELLAAKEMIP
jgi:aspartate-semialdehyde dehydrogenase